MRSQPLPAEVQLSSISKRVHSIKHSQTMRSSKPDMIVNHQSSSLTTTTTITTPTQPADAGRVVADLVFQ